MREQSLRLLLWHVLWLSLWATPAVADENSLKRVFDSASGLVVVQHWPQFEAKLHKLSPEGLLPLGSISILGELPAAAKACVDADSPTVMAFFMMEAGEDPPGLLYFLPTKNPQRLLKECASSAGPPDGATVELPSGKYVVRTLEGYSVWVRSGQQQQLLQRLDRQPANADGRFSQWADWTANSDLAVIVDRQAIGLLSARAIGPNGAGFEASAAAAAPVWLKPYVSVLMEAIHDATCVGLAAVLDEGGLVKLSARAELPADGKLAKSLASIRPIKRDLLAVLPKMPFDYLAAGALPAESSGAGIAIRLSGPPPTLHADELLRSIAGRAQAVAWLQATSAPGDVKQELNLLQILQVDDSGKFLDEYTKMAEQLDPAKLTARRAQFENLPALEFSIPIAQFAARVHQPEEAFWKSMMGPDTEPRIWLVAADQHTVAIGCYRRRLLTAGLKSIAAADGRTPSGQNIEYIRVALPADAFLVAYCRPAGLLTSARNAFASFDRNAAEHIPMLTVDRVAGAAARFVSNRLEIEAAAPVELVIAIERMLKQSRRSAEKDVPRKPIEPTARDTRRPAEHVTAERQAERSIAAGLNWMARHQSVDGRWSARDFERTCKDHTCTGTAAEPSDSGATAVALLAFLGAGQSSETKGPYRRTVFGGLQWLLNHQHQNGNLNTEQATVSLAHCLAAWALCENFAKTKNEPLGKAAQSAVEFLESTASSDSSLRSWRMLTLEAARQAGLRVDAEKYQKLATELTNGWKTDAPPGGESAGALLAHDFVAAAQRPTAGDQPSRPIATSLMGKLPARATRDSLITTIALYAHGGRAAGAWYAGLRKTLAETQIKEQCAAGSWPPDQTTDDARGGTDGRLMVTGLSILELELYYRYFILLQKSTQSGTTAKTPTQ